MRRQLRKFGKLVPILQGLVDLAKDTELFESVGYDTNVNTINSFGEIEVDNV